MKFSIITHGDLDGVVSSALYVQKLIAQGISRDEIQLVFAQPFMLPDEVEGENVVVLDIAVNNSDQSLTEDFIERIKDRLVVWIDHHRGWDEFLNKAEGSLRKKFIISDDRSAAETVYKTNSVSDLKSLYPFVKDSIAADTRSYELSEKGKLIEEAIKSNLEDDSIRVTSVWWILDEAVEKGVNYNKLIESQKKYSKRRSKTEEIAKKYTIDNGIAVLDVRDSEEIYDRTYLSLIGQKISPKNISVVLNKSPSGEDFILIATSRKDLDLLKAFNLKSGAKFRVTVKKTLDEVLDVLRGL